MPPGLHAVTPPGAGHVLSMFSDTFLLAFPALFSIVNPIGASLIFTQVTAGRARSESLALARTVALYSACLLIASIWIGSAILSFFGITIDSLRIAGGLVVAVRAWALLQAPEAAAARKEQQALQGGRTVAVPRWTEMAFFPMTMPFTVGPGTISVAIALSAARPASPAWVAFYLALSLAAAGVAGTVWLAYAYADRLMVLLGVTGARIVSRLAALILLCIGVQILSGGIEGLTLTIVRAANAP
jgi:multiple antibiotic resistance protein